MPFLGKRPVTTYPSQPPLDWILSLWPNSREIAYKTTVIWVFFFFLAELFDHELTIRSWYSQIGLGQLQRIIKLSNLFTFNLTFFFFLCFFFIMCLINSYHGFKIHFKILAKIQGNQNFTFKAQSIERN